MKNKTGRIECKIGKKKNISIRKSGFKMGVSATNFKLKYMVIGHRNIVMIEIAEIAIIAGITPMMHPKVTLVIDFTSFVRLQSSGFCAGGLNLKFVLPIVKSVSDSLAVKRCYEGKKRAWVFERK